MPAGCVIHTVRWSGGWELHIEGEGVTQVVDLSDAEAAVRSYLSTMYDAPADHVRVSVIRD